MDDETYAWCLFQEADGDESGSLDRDEIATLARNLGRPLSDAELEEAMTAMDDDGNGTVEFEEFYGPPPPSRSNRSTPRSSSRLVVVRQG
jgi:calmodulin